jgi:hypothetical protein
MNEKIKQLAEQAFIITTDGKIGHANNYMVEKFAQLIVKECARVFESEVDTWKQMDPYQGSIKRKGTKAIREHFGVEE